MIPVEEGLSQLAGGLRCTDERLVQFGYKLGRFIWIVVLLGQLLCVQLESFFLGGGAPSTIYL